MLNSIAISHDIPKEDHDFLKQFYLFDNTAPWQLSLHKDIYKIENSKEKLSLLLDFRQGNYRYRNQHVSKEPLVKAIKIKQKLPSNIIDATPGLLKDSLMLAGRGISIIAIERNPIIFVMVRRALLMLNDIHNIDYRFGDANKILSSCQGELIYLDPMYPAKKKNAQVKKDMQILHHIVGADEDSSKLLNTAQQNKVRIVVKRPSYAKPLSDEKPNFTSQIGATRFDIYLPKE